MRIQSEFLNLATSPKPFSLQRTTISALQSGIQDMSQLACRTYCQKSDSLLHSYIGKSTGAGSIGIWTHNMKSIEIVDYKSPHYTGKAMKMGAGVQGFEAYAAADAQGFRVVGGECPTVGLAGGYTQGGGHSAIASKHGLAADQTLEWEVVDGTGKYLKASRTENSDLFWALSGGGGGTYGVVMSMTSKVHKDTPVSGANLTFTSQGISKDVFYQAVSAYHATLPALVDAGVMSIELLTSSFFAIGPLTAPGIPASELRQLITPYLNILEQLGINYTMAVLQFPTYLQQFKAMQFPVQVGTAQYGGRLIPRSVVKNNNEALTSVARYINENGGAFVGVGLNVSKAVAGNVYNAVNPAWRETLLDTIIMT
jgi:FAD binding domain